MSLRIVAAAAIAAGALFAAPAAGEVFGGALRDQPLARFQEPLCPGVAGLRVEVAEMVVGRIRKNAETAGLDLGDPVSCKANVLVAVLPDGKAYANGLRDRRPYIFEALDKDQRAALFEAEGPARSWLRIVTRTRDGMVVSQRDTLALPPQTSMAMAHSKIYVATRRDILSAGVLIDAAAVPKVSLVQLADYATMRALAGDSAERVEMPGGTILTLFDDPQAAPAEMTEADRIFLRTLYAALPNNPAALTLATAQKRIDERAR